MFFRNRQEKFPVEFRINSSDWDYQSIIDNTQDISNKYHNNLNSLNDLQKEYKSKQDSLNELQDEYKQSQESLNELQEEYKQNQDSLNELQKEYENNLNSLKELQEEYKHNQDSFSELEKEYKSNQESLKELEKEYENKQESLSNLEKEYENKQESLTELEKEYETNQYSFNELQAEYNSNKKLLEELQDTTLNPNDLKDVILRIWRVNNKAKQATENQMLRRAKVLVEDNEEFEDNESDYVIRALNSSEQPIQFINNQTTSVLSILEENGFEIKDHTNDKYYDGMAVKVLIAETSDEVEESIITETIKPSIYYKNKLISNGEVIVTTPPNEEI